LKDKAALAGIEVDERGDLLDVPTLPEEGPQAQGTLLQLSVGEG